MQITTGYLFPLLVTFFLSFSNAWAQENGEETYTISLTQTAEIDKEIVEIEDKKVLTERYAVREGDHLWKLLRERKLLNKKQLPDIIAMLKQLNSDLGNLDLIHPGQTIVIPLIISPAKGMPVASKKALPRPKRVSIKDVKDLDLESFTVKSGDSLIKIIQDRYNIPKEHLHDEYLGLVKKLNPTIENIDTIYPGQKVRLPIYSPQIVRRPIETPPAPAPAPAPEPSPKPTPAPVTRLGKKLGELFTLLGEEWVHTGEHFIPIKSGGHVNLKAESFPILDLSNGNRIIIDLNADLPQEMAGLISSSWENYRVVHLEKKSSLREALNRILPSCDYPKLFRLGEPFEMVGDIHLTITADWIIQAASGLPDREDRIFMITIME
ncbi:MAG: LysM peptidoglycan-binding domain-containing protein, partial [Deltaproteobacteria bacterium]|nr:LysM peptidoglycan-binding domain-containing protein [Deltaproteobacteria bacterium]